MKSFAFSENISSKELKLFRESHNLSRKQMADLLNVSIRTLEGYEITDKKITGPIVTLFRLLKEYPELIDKYRVPSQVYPLRLYYMEKDNINTVIDVNMINRKVSFKNFTSNILARAFGNKEEATYEDFEDFLKSRCFPPSRDKLKIELEKLNIPFYDPLLIIEKTKGRMADDDYYIEIVRGIDND